MRYLRIAGGQVRHHEGQPRPRLLEDAERALVIGDQQLLEDTAAFYGLNASRLKTHAATMVDFAATRQLQVYCLENVRQLLQADVSAKVMLTEVVKLVKTLLTAPVTSYTAERSFSLLRRLKT